MEITWSHLYQQYRIDSSPVTLFENLRAEPLHRLFSGYATIQKL